MKSKVKIILIIFVSLILVFGTSFKEVTAKESEVSSSYNGDTSSNIQENNELQQLNTSTATVNNIVNTSDESKKLTGELWKDNEIEHSEVKLTEKDKKFLFMILGEIYYGNGMPYNDEMKLSIAYKLIYEHDFMYYMFSDGNLNGTCHIPIEKMNELLLNTINTKIIDYSKCTKFLNNENNTNKDVVVFSGSNRGDDQPIVKIKSIKANAQDANTVTIVGQIAHVTEFKPQKIDNFKAVAKINPNSKYGMFTVTKFEIQEKNIATSTVVNNENMSCTTAQNNKSKFFSTGDIFNVNFIIIIVLSTAVIIGYRKKVI